MPDQNLPSQTEQLKTWASERDSILLEISNLRSESNKLAATNRDLSASNSVLQNKINESTGRLEELAKKEKELADTISRELSEVSDKKSTTEAQVNALEKQVSILEVQKNSLIETIKVLNDTHDRVFDRVNALDQVVAHVVTTNEKTLDKINYFLKDLAIQENTLVGVVTSLSSVSDKALSRIEMLDKTVDRIVSVSTKNLSDINTLISK